MDDFITIMILGSSKFGESFYDGLCENIRELTADWRETGDYYRYRIIQSGEPGGVAAMARKFALEHENLRVGEKHQDHLIKDWLADKNRVNVDLCIAYMWGAGDKSDDPTWALLKKIVAAGIDEIRIY